MIDTLLETEQLNDKLTLCDDYDEDCDAIEAEGGCVRCWLYDPARGLCPYLLKGK